MARKRTARSEATRQRITESAADCFGEKGYEDASLDDIAKRAGVTKATLYYHFDSKEDLYADALAQVMSLFRDRLAEEIVEGDSPRETLDRLLWVMLEDNSSRARRFIPLPRPGVVDAEARRAISERRRDYESLVAGVIAQGQASGDLRPIGDPKVLARVLITGVGRIARWFDPAGEMTLPQMHQLLCSLLLDGLSSPVPSAALAAR